MLKMTKCIRICSAYSFRLSRRHSTLLLIASFIVTITVVLQLYSYRHRGRPHTLPSVGDFDYRPGSFLKGKQPNENESYCDFNYGLPRALKWATVQLHSTPEVGSKSPYKVIYNAVRGRAYMNYSKYDAVTYATQATPDCLYHIVEIAKYWDGPISVAVFVPNYDLHMTMQLMTQLCHCYPGMSKVSLHLFYPKKYPPIIASMNPFITTRFFTTTALPSTTALISIEEMQRKKLENFRNLDNKTRYQYIESVRKRKLAQMMQKMQRRPSQPPDLVFEDCSGSLNVPSFRKERNILYPINVGRNVARNASTTNYFIVSDIEMVPSEGLAPKFLTMVRKLMGDKKRDEGCVFAKTVFVAPLFEAERGEAIPHDKDTLVRMIAANRAMYFHQKTCSHCQRFPGLQSWLMRPAPAMIEPMLIARREYPYHRWEPLYFGTNKEPWYSEILSWEGKQDKMTQMLELCLQEYRMVVLDGAFLCHAAAPKSTTHNVRAEGMNAYRYMKIIRALKQKYPERPQCKVNFKCYVGKTAVKQPLSVTTTSNNRDVSGGLC